MNPEDNLKKCQTECRRLNTLQKKTYCWLVPEYFPLGVVTIIDGHPGTGKSQIAHYLASKVSTGSEWIDGSAVMDGAVLVIDVENDAERSTIWRMESNGADLGNIAVVEEFEDRSTGKITRFKLPQHIGLLENWVKTLEFRLVIIDTIMGHLDTHYSSCSDQEMRELILPLQLLAKKHQFAVVLLRHFNKSIGGDAVTKGSGSIAFSAVSRNTFVVVTDPHDPDTGHFLPGKSNIRKRAIGRTFQIVADGPESCRLQWTGISTYTANSILRAVGGQLDEPETADPVGEMSEILRPGPQSIQMVRDELTKMKYSWRSIERAKKQLGVVPLKNPGFGPEGEWLWVLPDQLSRFRTESGALPD